MSLATGILGTARRASCFIAPVAVIFLAAEGVWASTPTSGPALRESEFLGGGDTTGMMWQMLASALGILFLGVLAILVTKKLLPRLARSGGKRISVLETSHLGPGKHVHLLQIGDKKILVGSSRDGMTRLGDVTDAFGADYSQVARQVEASGSHADAAFPPQIKSGRNRDADEGGATK